MPKWTSRSASQRSRGFRPQTDWAHATGFTSLVLSSSTPVCSHFNLTAFADPEFIERMPETIRRLRGAVWTAVVPPTDPADFFRMDLAVGLAVAPAEAVAAGALPCPVSDAYWDGWLWHRFMPINSGGGREAITEGYEPEVDGRGQRRLEDNVLFFAAEAFRLDTVATLEVNIQWAFRWLLSLSNRT
jgi:hypothetical protein